MEIDAIRLTRQLVKTPSVNGPQAEAECARLLLPLLVEAGFKTRVFEMAHGRPSIIAETGPEGTETLCFSGHLDTVAFDEEDWSFDPLSGEMVKGNLQGRGASDMKSGIAAFVTALCNILGREKPKNRIAIVLTAGEESGCDGATFLAEQGLLPCMEAIVVAESTDNRSAWSHKGALWTRLSAQGKAAHGAQPHLGCNAIMLLVDICQKVERLFDNTPADNLLGSPTVTISSIHGGGPVNFVPAHASMTVDCRTVTGQSHKKIMNALQNICNGNANLDLLLDLNPVTYLPDHPWTSQIEKEFGLETAMVSYFTDAAIFQKKMPDTPVLILGPGDPKLVHAADESCSIENIETAVSIYSDIASNWMRK